MAKLRFPLAMFTALMGVSVRADSPADVRDRSLVTFEREVRQVLARYCIGCHGEEKQEAEVRLDRLDPDMATGSDAESWHDVLNKLNLGEMPPEDQSQPSVQERETLIGWLTAELERATDERRSTGGRVVLRRLTRYEYANTLRDLLGLHLDFAADLPAEPNSPEGLKNDGASLRMSPQQLEQYFTIARAAIGKAIVATDRPEVFSYDLAGSKLSGVKGPLYPPNVGTAVFPEYPMEGEFRIRVQASTTQQNPEDVAVLRVVLGVRPSPKNLKTKDVGEVKVTGDKDHPQTFEFRGRMENFPLHDPRTAYRERRYPELQVGFWNMTFDQAQLNNGRRTRQLRNQQVPEPLEEQAPPGGPVLTIHSVGFEAPIHDAWPPSHHTRILFPSELAETNEREYARQVLERFMQRSYRRPVADWEVEGKLAVYDEYRPVLGSIELAMREVLPEVLVAHHFLYLAEPTDGDDRKQPLTDHEFASRLSYFLWSTMPDDELFELASAGMLRDPDVLDRQVRAMIASDRGWEFVQHFTDQWLNLSGLDRVAVNPDYYPDFDDRLKEYMREETRHFFAELLHGDLSALNLIDSDFTMLNRPLADHYGIAGPKDNDFVRVPLGPEGHRGGLLGHGSILLSNSSGDDSHPIYRGVWIRDRLLGDTPASPPPDVPDLEREDPDFASLSLKQKLEVHREKESCNRCHRNIDPWGVPLENFDAVGRWRTEVQQAVGAGKPATFNNGVVRRRRERPEFTAVPVEAVAVLPSGQELRGPKGLKAHLLEHERDRFARALVRRMLAYALGRSIELVDQETIDSLAATFEESGYQLDELIVAIAKSEPFQTK